MSYPLSYMVAVVALVWLYCTRTRWAALRSSRGCALLFCDFEERHYRYRGQWSYSTGMEASCSCVSEVECAPSFPSWS